MLVLGRGKASAQGDGSQDLEAALVKRIVEINEINEIVETDEIVEIDEVWRVINFGQSTNLERASNFLQVDVCRIRPGSGCLGRRNLE